MIEIRPQPVGIYPSPASNLLLPRVGQVLESSSCSQAGKRSSVDSTETALACLLNGELTESVPAEWLFFVAAARGDTERALELFGDDDSQIAIYNRFVLQPSKEAYSQACQQLSGDLGVLLDVAAFTFGVADAIEESFPLDDELLALALATTATASQESGNTVTTISKLKMAVSQARYSSPLLASLLISHQADAMTSMAGFPVPLVAQAYKEAIELGEGCKLPWLLAEMHTKLGMVLQDSAGGGRSQLLAAVSAYQTALQNSDIETERPELFAQLQNNLGLAYLSMPSMEASNQLRSGIAVQSFRHALKVYTIEQHPAMWASVSMNLANALQYAPTSHAEENLIQAVEIYEGVLQVRSRAKSPVEYAIVLLNQANALAHLGIFKPALEKLSEAYKLFHWYEQTEQAHAAKELVDLINERLGQGKPSEIPTS